MEVAEEYFEIAGKGGKRTLTVTSMGIHSYSLIRIVPPESFKEYEKKVNC